MKVLKVSRREFVLRPSKGEETINAFVFNFDAFPLEPEPKRVCFISHFRRGKMFVMTWNKFSNEVVFRDNKGEQPDVALIRKEGMRMVALPERRRT